VVSSACDELLEQLNEISFLADMGEPAEQRPRGPTVTRLGHRRARPLPRRLVLDECTPPTPLALLVRSIRSITSITSINMRRAPGVPESD
jgi:hypothetical protein